MNTVNSVLLWFALLTLNLVLFSSFHPFFFHPPSLSPIHPCILSLLLLSSPFTYFYHFLSFTVSFISSPPFIYSHLLFRKEGRVLATMAQPGHILFHSNKQNIIIRTLSPIRGGNERSGPINQNRPCLLCR